VKEGQKGYLLRIDQKLWDDLNTWAGQEFRSVNGQIELILKRAVEEHRRGQKHAGNRAAQGGRV
jgi:hypothetical protein